MQLKDYLMPALAIVATIVFVFGVYVLGSGLMGSHGAEGKNASAIVLAALEKEAKYGTGNYTYEYTDDLDGYPVTTRLVHSPEFAIVETRNSIYKKTIYLNSSLRALCISFGRQTSCSEVEVNSTLEPSFLKSEGLLFDQHAEKDAERFKLLVDKGAIKFGTVEEGSEGGKECDVVKYTLDYSVLNLADLNNLGMSPNDPVLFYSKNYGFEYCISGESDVLSIKLDYSFMGEPKHTVTKLAEAKWGIADAGEFAVPALVDANATEALFLDALSAEKSVLACARNAATRDMCVRTFATENNEPDMCLLAGTQKDRCILILAPQQLRDDLCAKVDDAGLKDDCWVEMAARKGDGSLCANVINDSKKEYCASVSAKGS